MAFGCFDRYKIDYSPRILSVPPFGDLPVKSSDCRLGETIAMKAIAALMTKLYDRRSDWGVGTATGLSMNGCRPEYPWRLNVTALPSG